MHSRSAALDTVATRLVTTARAHGNTDAGRFTVERVELGGQRLARVFLVAHAEYWQNRLVFEVLHDPITR